MFCDSPVFDVEPLLFFRMYDAWPIAVEGALSAGLVAVKSKPPATSQLLWPDSRSPLMSALPSSALPLSSRLPFEPDSKSPFGISSGWMLVSKSALVTRLPVASAASNVPSLRTLLFGLPSKEPSINELLTGSKSPEGSRVAVSKPPLKSMADASLTPPRTSRVSLTMYLPPLISPSSVAVTG